MRMGKMAGRTAVAVVGVLAEADVDSDEEVWELLAQKLDALDDGSFGVVCRSTAVVLTRRSTFEVFRRAWTRLLALCGHAKEDYRREAFGNERGQKALELADPPALLARQAVDGDFGVRFVRQEDRVHQHVSKHSHEPVGSRQVARFTW
jgi:hypothetical protein